MVSAAGSACMAGVVASIALCLLTLKTTTTGVFPRAFSLPGNFQVGPSQKRDKDSEENKKFIYKGFLKY